MKYTFTLFALVMMLRSQAQITHWNIHAKMMAMYEMEDGTMVPFWGFGVYDPGTSNKIFLPGPMIRATRGDSVVIHFFNLSAEDHTIHLHGLDVNQANDGAPSTSYAVSNNDSTIYSFNATHQGTFLYHCHVMTVQHLAKGMYGMVFIDHPIPNTLKDDGTGFNRQYHFLTSEMDVSWNQSPMDPGFHLFDPDYFMVNGKQGIQLFEDSTTKIEAQAGDSIALHLGHIGYDKVRYIFPPGSNAMVHLSDGRELSNPFAADTLVLYPGERYDVILRPTTVLSDYIQVTYHDLVIDSLRYTNYIGINMHAHPNGITSYSNPKAKLFCFPNPFDGSTDIIVPAEAEGNYMVYDLFGKIMMQTHLQRGAQQLDLSAFPAGIYVISNGKYSTRLIRH